MDFLKRCQTCKSKKELFRNSVSPTGKVGYVCRVCNTKRFKKYRKNNKEKIYIISKKSINKFKFKHLARLKVAYALKTGRLCKPKVCEICFKRKELFGHHENYNKPLEVLWLCRNCHIQIHK